MIKHIILGDFTKKKFIYFILAILIIPCSFAFTACNNNNNIVYTVTESEWKTNFKLTKGSTQPQGVSFLLTNQPQTMSQTLTPITSYTIFAEGVNYGEEGTCTLKVAPEGMSIEFYIDNTLKEEESGTYANTEVFYNGLTSSITTYFPFENSYNDFTFNETKNAYIAENFATVLNDEYDASKTYTIYTKSAEVTFINGYLNTIKVDLCEKTYESDTIYSSFVFTFSNINNTTVDLTK